MIGRLDEEEPATLVGALASLLGFGGLLGADVDTLQALGTAVGLAGTQGILTRPFVYSSKTVKQLAGPDDSTASLSEVMDWRPGSTRQREPAVAIGAATLVTGFLVQFFAGVGLTESLVAAGGITGVQTAATRSRVYSPASARGAAIAGIATAGIGSPGFDPDQVRKAMDEARLLPT